MMVAKVPRSERAPDSQPQVIETAPVAAEPQAEAVVEQPAEVPAAPERKTLQDWAAADSWKPWEIAGARVGQPINALFTADEAEARRQFVRNIPIGKRGA